MKNLLRKIKDAVPSRGGGIQNSITSSRELAELLLGCDLSTSPGVVVTPKTVMGVAAVQAAVRVIAENVGMLPFPLYERQQIGGREYKIKARGHELWPILNRAPNTFMTAQAFVEMMTARYLLYFHAFALKNHVGGKLRELIPIHPRLVQFEQGPDMRMIYHVQMADGRVQTFGADRIFHLHDMSAEGLAGRSRIAECRDAIGLAKSAELYGSEFFRNDGTPSGVLSTKEPLPREDIDKVRDSWMSGGGGRRGGVKIVDNDFKWTSISTTAEAAQMIETRKFQVTEVARIFRIPPHKIADNERATFNNIESQELDFQTNSMMPHYRRWESAVNTQLVPSEQQGRFYSKIDNRAMLRGDTRARGEFYLKMKTGKIMTSNEIRDLEDMNPHDDGDVLENPAVQSADGPLSASAADEDGGKT